MEKQFSNNPFFNNYIFSYKDLDRPKVSKWKYPILWFLPTYVQISPEGVFHYKLSQGRIYFLKMVHHDKEQP